MMFLLISAVIYFQIPVDIQNTQAPDLLAGSLLWWVSLIILPISFTLAVVRSHLWDIDVVIRRTLVYGALTATLALVYFSSVITIQQIFRLFTGQQSPFALVISTLAIAGLFSPLRRSIQSNIDRRFFRSQYNSEKALARFQHLLREQNDLNAVESELTSIVQATLQPEWLALWVREPGGLEAVGHKPKDRVANVVV